MGREGERRPVLEALLDSLESQALHGQLEALLGSRVGVGTGPSDVEALGGGVSEPLVDHGLLGELRGGAPAVRDEGDAPVSQNAEVLEGPPHAERHGDQAIVLLQGAAEGGQVAEVERAGGGEEGAHSPHVVFGLSVPLSPEDVVQLVQPLGVLLAGHSVQIRAPAPQRALPPREVQTHVARPSLAPRRPPAVSQRVTPQHLSLPSSSNSSSRVDSSWPLPGPVAASHSFHPSLRLLVPQVVRLAFRHLSHRSCLDLYSCFTIYC